MTDGVQGCCVSFENLSVFEFTLFPSVLSVLLYYYYKLLNYSFIIG